MNLNGFLDVLTLHGVFCECGIPVDLERFVAGGLDPPLDHIDKICLEIIQLIDRECDLHVLMHSGEE